MAENGLDREVSDISDSATSETPRSARDAMVASPGMIDVRDCKTGGSPVIPLSENSGSGEESCFMISRQRTGQPC